MTQVGSGLGLPAAAKAELGMYRFRVFVERLGWELPGTEAGEERDQFDSPTTLYAMVRDSHRRICGCARLLPTTAPYLLSEVFPQLMAGQELPCSPVVWELSRYTTELVHDEPDDTDFAAERFRQLLRAVVGLAMAQGAERLITFSYVGVERLARRFGLHVHRAGDIHLVDGRPVLAFWIEFDAQTLGALGLMSQQRLS